ncbi:MAG: PQQ-binding-like beta-propeller repeat protein [Anaerolineae bacterium]
MNQRELTDRFSSDVDHLLREAGLTEPKPTAPEYDDMLTLARTLATSDFSQQSRIRRSLRRRLLNRIEVGPVTSAEIPGPISRLKQLFMPGQVKSGQPLNLVRLLNHRAILPLLASLIIAFGAITVLSQPGLLPVRQKMMALLAQMLLYLPAKGEVAPHGLALRWQFRGTDGVSSPPVAAENVIYVGSNAGYLYALDAQTGQEIWRFQTTGGVNLAPTVASGLVYVASDGQLYALDSQTGREQWRFQAEGQVSMGPTSAGELILTGADNGTLYALEAQTGQERWQFKTGNAILPDVTVFGDTFYVGSQDHYLYALELPTGRERWRFNAGNWLSFAPIEVAGLLYIGSYDESLYVLEAATGREQRRYDLGKAVRTSATLAGGMIYFGSYDSYLHAVDGASGEEKWRFKMGKQTRSAPVVSGNVIYIGSGDGYLYEVNARTGAEVARYRVDSQIYTAPTVWGETVYFVSGKGELYAVHKTSLPSTVNSASGLSEEPAGFQFTPGGWYVAGKDSAIHFRGRMVDGAGRPVNGFSIQADNGTTQLLAPPSGPNRWQSQAQAGEWEIVIPEANQGAGWWWLTAVRYECAADEFDPHCQKFTRLSESVKVQIVYPAETIINADWTCQWECQNLNKK